MKRPKNLILEFTEFNAMRLNPDTVAVAPHVDNPQLSINAFDKHSDKIRQAISQLGSLHNALGGTKAYRNLKNQLSLSEQDIQGLKVIRVTKSNSIDYDVYISFIIREKEYWGVIKDIFGKKEFISPEVFQDQTLIQTQIWTKRLRGLLVKTVRNWFKPQFGNYTSLLDDIMCYSAIDGRLMLLPINSKIEVLKSYDDRLIFEYEDEQYTLRGDNFVYFNWWFEKIEEEED